MTTAPAVADATAPPFPAPSVPASSSASMPDHFSFSAMTTFQECPRQWSYRYLRRARPECISSSLLAGGAVHAALADIQRRRMAGGADDFEAAMEAFDIHWLTRGADKEVLYAKGEDAAVLRRQADELLALFLSEPRPAGRVLAARASAAPAAAGDVGASGRLGRLGRGDRGGADGGRLQDQPAGV